MANALLDALPDEPVLQSNSLATLTPSLVIIPTAQRSTQSIIALARVRDVRRVKTTYPGLLVISAALFLIAAAAYASKQGSGAHIPAAVLGLLFLALYFSSRKAAVAFLFEGEVIETIPGSLREATALIRAVQKARSNVT
ncbi:MAG TPA: hypothetical protein VH351_17115 [Bryobacteraceae bacterium]|jgi:hypothetical protein|nr:hypothetical protein [Bryobacteraceae bacterium]